MYGPARMKGQSVIEFSLTASVFLLLLMAVFSFGIASFQRSAIDYQISRTASRISISEVPDSGVEAVKKLVGYGSTLDTSEMTVKNAKIELLDETETVLGDPIATGLGAAMKNTTATYLRVSADISFPLAKGILGGDNVHNRHFEKTYTLERRYEVA